MTEEKAAFDPGWNDPPLFSYDSHQQSAKGYALNKRVAYTGDSQNVQRKDQDIISSPGAVLPPMGPSTGLLKMKSNVEQNQVSVETNSDKAVSLAEVLENFSKTIEEVHDAGNEKESSEIRKRLTMMEKMWSEQKFPSAMQQKIYNMSEDLRRNDFESCDKLQRSVMVDHTSLCSSWMSAIRLLINLKRSQQQQ